jgi:flagellar biosynthesis GTPase FlhF
MKGCVYRLFCKDPDVTDCYIGSTKDMKKRMKGHRHDVECSNSLSYCAKKAQFIRDNGGWAKWSYEVLESLDVESREELRIMEQNWIDQIPTATLNGVPAWLSEEERATNKIELRTRWYEANKEKIREQKAKYREANREKIMEQKAKYREANKEKAREQAAKYREANREKVRELQARWCEANKEKVREQTAKYREANKEKVREQMARYREEVALVKVECSLCGATICRGNMSAHQKRPICLNNRK